jgi:hypothetical protein
VDIYRCTEDQYVSDMQKKAGWRYRVRGVAMNWFVGGSTWLGVKKRLGGVKVFFRGGDCSSPSDTFVIFDEHPDSMGWPDFDSPGQAHDVLIDKQDPVLWNDLPGSLHRGAGAFVDIDGHAYLKKWKEAATRPPVKFKWYTEWRENVPSKPGSDIYWFDTHSTEFR